VAVLLVSSLIGLAFIAGIALIFFRRGWKSLLAIVPITAGMAYAAFAAQGGPGIEYGIMVIAPVFTGIAAGYSFRNRRSLLFFLVITSVVLGSALTAHYYHQKLYTDTDPLDDTKKRAVELLSQSQMSEVEREDALAKLDSSLDLLKDVMPFAYFLNSLATALIGYFLSRALVSRTGAPDVVSLPGIEMVRLHDYFIFALIAGWLAVLLVDHEAYRAVYVAGLNVALCISALYLLQAVGIVKYVLAVRNVPSFVLPLVLAFIVLLGTEFILFFSIIFLSIGALDFWADFRKLEAKDKN
jgi:hypothetical protein